METIFTTVGQKPILIIPDIEIDLDYQPMVTYIYKIYTCADNATLPRSASEPTLLRNTLESLNYLGCATFNEFESDFFYMVEGCCALNPAGTQDLMDVITHYRDNPLSARLTE